MSVIGSLIVDLKANTAKFSREMKRAETGIDRMQARLKLADRSLLSLERSFRGPALAATGLATAVGLLAKRQIEAADAIGETSRNIGLTAQQYQALMSGAKAAGVAQEQFTTSMTQFIKRVGEARQGGGQLVAFLGQYDQALSENIQSSASQEQALGLVADAIANQSDAALQAAIANAAFGRSGISMIEFVKGGKVGLDEMSAAAIESGRVLSNDVIARAGEAADAMDILGDQIKADLTRALIDLGPTLITVGEKFREFVGFVTEGARALQFFAEKAGLLNTDFAGGNEDQVLTRVQVRMERLQELQANLARATEKGLIGDQRRIIAEMEATGAEVGKLNARLEEIRSRNNAPAPTLPPATGGIALPKPGGAVDEAAKAAERAATAYANYIEQLQRGNQELALEAAGLKKQIPLLQAKQKAEEILGRDLLPQEMRAVVDLVNTNAELTETLDQQAQARDRVAEAAEEQMKAAEKAAEAAAKAAEKAAEEMREPFVRAAENIQSSFGDMFTDIFRNGIGGFKGFADRVKDILARMAGEIAALMVFRPQLLAGVLGVGGAGAAGTAGATGTGTGILGAISGGGGGLASLGRFFGDPSGAVASGIEALAGLTGSQNLLNLSTFSAVNGLGALGTGISGLLGGLAGNALFGGQGGVGGSLGATIGAAFGPLGAVAGGLFGGAIGGLFGGEKAPPKLFFSSVPGATGPEGLVGTDNQGNPRNLAQNSPFGQIIFSAQHTDIPVDAGTAALKALADFDRGIASALDASTISAINAMPRFQAGGKGGVSVAESGLERLNLIGQTIGRSENPFEKAISKAILGNSGSGAGRIIGDAAVEAAFTAIGERVSEISLVKEITEAGDASNQFADALTEINRRFDQLAKTAQEMDVPLAKINEARQREINALRQQAGLGQVQDLFQQLTATGASSLPFETVLSQARGMFTSARDRALANDPAGIADISAAASNYLGLLRSGFASGPEFARGNAEVIIALSNVVESIGASADQSSADNATAADRVIATNEKLDVQTATLAQINQALQRLLAGSGSLGGVSASAVAGGF